MAKPPKPQRNHQWKIPAIHAQNKSFHDDNNIRVMTREHPSDFYPPPYYRVDMFQPLLGVNGSWIPLMTPNGKEVWYFDTLAEAEDKGVKEARKEMDKWPTPATLPSLPEVTPLK